MFFLIFNSILTERSRCSCEFSPKIEQARVRNVNVIGRRTADCLHPSATCLPRKLNSKIANEATDAQRRSRKPPVHDEYLFSPTAKTGDFDFVENFDDFKNVFTNMLFNVHEVCQEFW